MVQRQPEFVTTPGELTTVCHCLEQAVPGAVRRWHCSFQQWHTVVRNAG